MGVRPPGLPLTGAPTQGSASPATATATPAGTSPAGLAIAPLSLSGARVVAAAPACLFGAGQVRGCAEAIGRLIGTAPAGCRN